MVKKLQRHSLASQIVVICISGGRKSVWPNEQGDLVLVSVLATMIGANMKHYKQYNIKSYGQLAIYFRV